MKAKYSEKKVEILHSLEKHKHTSSNLREFHETAIMVSANAATAWSSSGYKQREPIQKIIFPEGVYYDLEKQAFRTTRIMTQ